MAAIIFGNLSESLAFPSIPPALALNFASGAVDHRVQFSRASAATLWNGRNVINVPTQIPRFDTNVSGIQKALLIERSQTNFATGTFPNSNDVIVSTTSDEIAPDGTLLRVRRITKTGTSFDNSIANGSVPSATIITFSCWLKAGGADTNSQTAQIQMLNGASSVNCFPFILSGPGSIALFGGSLPNNNVVVHNLSTTEWTRVGAVSSAPANRFAILPCRPPNFANPGLGSVLVWGPQLQEQPFADSYIYTNGSAVTRSADLVSLAGNNFSSLYNPTEGTIVYHSRQIAAEDGTLFAINDNSDANTIRLRALSGGSHQLIVRSGDADQVSISGSTPLTSFTKGAVAYKQNDFALCVNGGAISTANLGSLPISPTQLCIGNNRTAQSDTYVGYFQEFYYYPRRLPNDQLQALTRR